MTELADIKILLDGKQNVSSCKQALSGLANYIDVNGINTLAPFLPILLSLKGTPFNLNDHFPLEPLYNLDDVPPNQLLMCGRQVSKSTSLAAKTVLLSAITPFLSTINVCPLFEQIRRFSNNYVKPFIEDSPIRPLLVGEGKKQSDNSVFQRSFINGAIQHFTFAFLDAERARGISGDMLNLDEIQDIDIDFIPVLEACLDASKLGLVNMSGTPKTTDNTIHHFWEMSSQAQWITKCSSCSYYNIAALEHGLDDMVQKKGFCCRKCSEVLNPREGFFYHTYKDRIKTFPGWHIPQPIMPMHYGVENKWHKLYERKKNWPRHRYLNEILGESCDVGTRLVTLTQLKHISRLPWDLDIAGAMSHRGEYLDVYMGIDWGGGGGGEIKSRRGQLTVEGGTTSFTVIAIVGFKPGSIEPHLLYTERFDPSMEPQEQARRILDLNATFNCNLIAHDFGGAGDFKETALIQAGIQRARIMPCLYTRATASPIVTYKESNQQRSRHYYSIDKTRLLQLICACINANLVSFPRWPESTALQEENNQSNCLYLDFLALIEQMTEGKKGPDSYIIVKNPKKPDDFVHAFAFACIAHWHRKKAWPDLASKFGIKNGSETNEWE